MAVEKAKEFLELAAKDEKLKALLQEISLDDLKQAVEEVSLDEVAGGGCNYNIF